jgi:hypothetical protein
LIWQENLAFWAMRDLPESVREAEWEPSGRK